MVAYVSMTTSEQPMIADENLATHRDRTRRAIVDNDVTRAALDFQFHRPANLKRLLESSLRVGATAMLLASSTTRIEIEPREINRLFISLAPSMLLAMFGSCHRPTSRLTSGSRTAEAESRSLTAALPDRLPLTR